MSQEIVVGIHSIVEALNNPERSGHKLFTTKENKGELTKKINLNNISDLNIIESKPHDIQEEGKKIYKELDFRFSRIPSNTFLLTNRLELKNLTYLFFEWILVVIPYPFSKFFYTNFLTMHKYSNPINTSC